MTNDHLAVSKAQTAEWGFVYTRKSLGSLTGRATPVRLRHDRGPNCHERNTHTDTQMDAPMKAEMLMLIPHGMHRFLLLAGLDLNNVLFECAKASEGM